MAERCRIYWLVSESGPFIRKRELVASKDKKGAPMGPLLPSPERILVQLSLCTYAFDFYADQII